MTNDRPTGRDRPDPGPRETAPGEFVGPARPIDPGQRPGSGPAPGGAPPDDVDTAATTLQPAVDLPPAGPGAADASAGQPPRPARRPRQRSPSAMSAVDKVRRANFPIVMRGYDRTAVDSYVAEVAQLVAELEATQLPESVVQRALDQVGDQTSGILKHAHEASEEITRRSREQAEEQLTRAEREADAMRREAEERARRVEEDTRAVWDERRRMIEDIRHLADDVLGLADDALDRLPPPAGSGDVEADEPPEVPLGDDTDDAPSTAETTIEEDEDEGPPRTGEIAG
jgi:DivIVA domain-containing protein